MFIRVYCSAQGTVWYPRTKQKGNSGRVHSSDRCCRIEWWNKACFSLERSPESHVLKAWFGFGTIGRCGAFKR